MHSSKYLNPGVKAEIHLELGLLASKILHYATNYGCSTSPSWTLHKDVPDTIILDIIDAGDSAPLLIHMAQMHIYYMAYIETFYPKLDIKDIRVAQFQFLGKDQNRTNIYTGRVTIDKDKDNNLSCG
jgi:hypothetical protein